MLATMGENRAARGCAKFLPVNLAIETEVCGGKYELQKFHDVILPPTKLYISILDGIAIFPLLPPKIL